MAQKEIQNVLENLLAPFAGFFNKPTSVVEVLTIGSKQDIRAIPPQPVMFAPAMLRGRMDRGRILVLE